MGSHNYSVGKTTRRCVGLTVQSEQLKSVVLANGESIAYRERAGSNKLLLLVHGNMTSSKHWDLLINALDDSFTIIAPDLRGFGQSSYHSKITQIQDFSDDLKGFVDALSLKNFDLIGWSTGGAVVMQFSADYPGYCQKLVLLASASTRGYPFFSTSPEGTPNLKKRFMTIEEVEQDPIRTQVIQGLYDTKNREGLKDVWNAGIYTHNQPEEALYNDYVDDMLTQRNLADVYHALNTFNISDVDNEVAQGTKQIQSIEIPVLILRGDRDYIVTAQMTDEIIEDFKGRAQYEVLVDCGHSPLVDDCPQLVEKIERFLLNEKGRDYEIKR